MADDSFSVEQAPEASLEQQRALALAQARRRRAEQQSPESGSLGRQLGLAARAAGPTAAGALMGGAAGSILPGVGPVIGAGAGSLAMNLVHLMDRLGGTNYVDQMMDKAGLPKPESSGEKLAAAGAESMAGMAGITGAARAFLPRRPGFSAPPEALVTKGPGVAEQLTASPGLGAASAATSGVASEAVRQEGGGPTEQFLVSVVGGAAPAMGAPAAKGVVDAVKGAGRDTVAAIRAAAGHQPSVVKLAEDAMQTAAGDQGPELRAAMRGATTLVPGAKPTVAEAIAEHNMQVPDRQVGGAIVKLQDELSGAKSIEDIMPSKMKANQAAVGAHISATEQQAAQLRNMAFESARRTTGPNTLGPRIDLTLLKDNAQLRNNKVALRAIDDLNKQLLKSADKGGYVDPETLYSIRQNSRQIINQYFDKGLTKDQAGYILGQFNRGIDKAMVDGGAVGWKAYLETYRSGMAAAEAHAARLKEAGSIAQGMSSQQPGQMVKEELIHIPTLLHRPTMFANFVLKLIAKDATTPVMREVATRMQDPEQFLQLISRPVAHPAKQAVNQVMLHAAILANLIQKDQLQEQPSQ